MVHPRGEVLSFAPLRYVRGEFEAADLDRLVALYRPLLPRPPGLENVALMGPLLYDTAGPFVLPEAEAGVARVGAEAGADQAAVPPRLEVLELYRGWLRPRYRELRGRRCTLGLWAVGLERLKRELSAPSRVPGRATALAGAASKPDRVGLMTARLALLAAPVVKVGRKKREFHQLQMAHRAHLLAYSLRRLVPPAFRYLTPSGAAMVLLDGLLRLDPFAARRVRAALVASPQARRNRNALYRRVNWLLEKYEVYRRAGYKGGEPSYALENHSFEPDLEQGWSQRLELGLAGLKAAIPPLPPEPGWGGLRALVGNLSRPPHSCCQLFGHRSEGLAAYVQAAGSAEPSQPGDE